MLPVIVQLSGAILLAIMVTSRKRKDYIKLTSVVVPVEGKVPSKLLDLLQETWMFRFGLLYIVIGYLLQVAEIDVIHWFLSTPLYVRAFLVLCISIVISIIGKYIAFKLEKFRLKHAKPFNPLEDFTNGPNHTDKSLSDDEYVYNFYKKHLRRGMWVNDNKKLVWLVEELKKEKLSSEQRIKLRGSITVDEISKNDVFGLLTTAVSLMVAAVIGFVVAEVQSESAIIKTNSFLVVISGIVAYILILTHLARRKSKTAIVKQSLNNYERLLEVSGDALDKDLKKAP
ncbi:hypothetical protein [Cohnella mopanensis]|uniref:hypothetical protein n=1 Tax=Cohnella mopanensis TaxID=2911966 RepID=UPI001EF94A51|nr:hypothetical protein [Cohnella mopanensis]